MNTLSGQDFNEDSVALKPLQERKKENRTIENCSHLTDKFSSFAEAMMAFSRVYQGDTISGSTNYLVCAVEYFCLAKGIATVTFDSRSINSINYFQDELWFKQWAAKNNFTYYGRGVYVQLDDNKAPIAFINCSVSRGQNFSISYSGEVNCGCDLATLIEKSFTTKVFSTSSDRSFFEFEGFDSYGNADFNTKQGRPSKKIQTEFWPYFGEEPLTIFKDFMESESAIMILIGLPGCGKSSLIEAAVEHLRLKAIYAFNRDVMEHKKFVTELMGFNDKLLSQWRTNNDGLEPTPYTLPAFSRLEGIMDKTINDRNSGAMSHRFGEQLRPVMVIEDADNIIGHRTAGNPLMQQLLNETDGAKATPGRKLIITTNLRDIKDIDPALVRAGRCFATILFDDLSPEQAVVARRVAEMPDFKEMPIGRMSLADALAKETKAYAHRVYGNR